MAYPTAYASETTGELLGDLIDQRRLLLLVTIDASDTTVIFDSVVNMPLPTYLRLDNEILKATASLDNQRLTVTREALGTTAAAHTSGATAFVVVTSQHFVTLRDQALLAQKYHGLVGLDAGKAASPAVGEVYVATDTKKVYVCTQAGTWSFLGGLTAHSETLREGELDDHSTLYFTETSATAWHTGKSGGHVVNGNSHNHTEGRGAGRLRTAAPGSYNIGDCYYNTTTKELNIALNSTTWGKVTGAPTGVIIMLQEADVALYGGACPPGWTRHTFLDGRYMKGAGAGIVSLGTGGTSSHSHTYDSSNIPAHTHSIAAMNGSSGSNGSHSHSFSMTLDTGSSGGFAISGAGTANDSSFGTGSAGDHSHSATYPATNTNGAYASSNNAAASVSSAATDAVANDPPYKEVIFCRKT